MPEKRLTRGQRQKILETGIVVGFARLAQMAGQMGGASAPGWQNGFAVSSEEQLLQTFLLHEYQPLVKSLCVKFGSDVVRAVALEVLATGRYE